MSGNTEGSSGDTWDKAKLAWFQVMALRDAYRRDPGDPKLQRHAAQELARVLGALRDYQFQTMAANTASEALSDPVQPDESKDSSGNSGEDSAAPTVQRVQHPYRGGPLKSVTDPPADLQWRPTNN